MGGAGHAVGGAGHLRWVRWALEVGEVGGAGHEMGGAGHLRWVGWALVRLYW